MQRYFFHLQNRSHTPKDAAALLSRARQLAGSQVVVRDSRVSGKYIEFDTSIPDSVDATGLEQLMDIVASIADDKEIELTGAKDEF